MIGHIKLSQNTNMSVEKLSFDISDFINDIDFDNQGYKKILIYDHYVSL